MGRKTKIDYGAEFVGKTLGTVAGLAVLGIVDKVFLKGRTWKGIKRTFFDDDEQQDAAEEDRAAPVE
jgi:hypothetical protein